ncbi:MAG TPA: glycoside hydrolase family 3 N-terminal domain-containing protein [Ktedonosporobacter sp.]|nr:glycoside hydrolase family 3 N-terminal domain-containing protein [Ktedonosporobacter sp.]
MDSTPPASEELLQDEEQEATLKHPVLHPANKLHANSIQAASKELPVPPPLPRILSSMSRERVILSMLLLFALLLHALGSAQFLGSQGWAYVLGGSTNTADTNLLQTINTQVKQANRTGTKPPPLTPEQYVDLIVQKMTLDQKLGQMMIVQFTGSSYSLDLSTMISQYNVGAVIMFSVNGNIVNKTQLKELTQQMQSNSTLIPLAIATDQEGGYVNRLQGLDGPRPAPATIGATNDPTKATAAGIQDALDLASYGINLNLAPVVDVDNTPYSELHQDLRTYGNTPTKVTQMVGAYLQGLQQSGKVIGTLKHFPGLGSVIVDPHKGVPLLNRSKDQLEQIDWAPYRALIQQGGVHAIMVTHELVPALDKTRPSSLSNKVVQNILRDEMGFQGVIMTDSLTMLGVTDYYPPAQAAALSVEAGCDLLMGAASPNEVATMINGIKQAIAAGTINQQRINDSVRRILLMKYAMGLLTIPKL